MTTKAWPKAAGAMMALALLMMPAVARADAPDRPKSWSARPS
jgi:hypothetical protein